MKRGRKRKYSLNNGLFKCEICLKQVSNIAKHLRSHDKSMFPCFICGAELTRKDNLKRHIRMQHSGLVQQTLAPLADTAITTSIIDNYKWDPNITI